ncbi:MAG TPA: hypothetical protein VF777_08090 [Phycisphaerales bacterium]
MDDASFSTIALSYDMPDCLDPSMPQCGRAHVHGDIVIDDRALLLFAVACDAWHDP